MWHKKLSNNFYNYVEKTILKLYNSVVFLYFPLDDGYWSPVPMFGDIPPGSVIIAQHVPLKPAVEAGIIPVYTVRQMIVLCS